MTLEIVSIQTCVPATEVISPSHLGPRTTALRAVRPVYVQGVNGRVRLLSRMRLWLQSATLLTMNYSLSALIQSSPAPFSTQLTPLNLVTWSAKLVVFVPLVG